MRGKNKKNNTFIITTIAILLILIVVVTAYFIHRREPNLALSELIKIIIDGSTVVLIFYAVLSYIDTQKKNEGDIRQQKVTATFEVLTEWYKSPLVDYLKICNAYEGKEEFKLSLTDTKRFVELVDREENYEYKQALRGVLNHFEVVATAISEELLDEDFTYRCLNVVTKMYFDKYIDYIRFRSKTSNSIIYKEFIEMAERWRNYDELS